MRCCGGFGYQYHATFLFPPSLLQLATEYLSALLKSFRETIPSFSQKIKSLTSQQAPLLIALLLNWLRDFVWTALSYHQSDVDLKEETDDFWRQTGAQFIYSTLAIITGYLGIVMGAQVLKKHMPHKEASASAWAAAIAVITWNYGQKIGVDAFKQRGFNTTNAGYFSLYFYRHL